MFAALTAVAMCISNLTVLPITVFAEDVATTSKQGQIVVAPEWSETLEYSGVGEDGVYKTLEDDGRNWGSEIRELVFKDYIEEQLGDTIEPGTLVIEGVSADYSWEYSEATTDYSATLITSTGHFDTKGNWIGGTPEYDLCPVLSTATGSATITVAEVAALAGVTLDYERELQFNLGWWSNNPDAAVTLNIDEVTYDISYEVSDGVDDTVSLDKYVTISQNYSESVDFTDTTESGLYKEIPNRWSYDCDDNIDEIVEAIETKYGGNVDENTLKIEELVVNYNYEVVSTNNTATVFPYTGGLNKADNWVWAVDGNADYSGSGSATLTASTLASDSLVVIDDYREVSLNAAMWTNNASDSLSLNVTDVVLYVSYEEQAEVPNTATYEFTINAEDNTLETISFVGATETVKQFTIKVASSVEGESNKIYYYSTDANALNYNPNIVTNDGTVTLTFNSELVGYTGNLAITVTVETETTLTSVEDINAAITAGDISAGADKDDVTSVVLKAFTLGNTSSDEEEETAEEYTVTLDSEYTGAWSASSTIPRSTFEAIGGDVLVKLTVETKDPEVGERNYLAKPMNICVSWDAITFSLQSDTALSYSDGFFVIPNGTSTVEFVVPKEVWESFLDYDGGTESCAGLAFQVCDVIVKSAVLSKAETAQSEITTVTNAMGPFIMDGMTYEEALEAASKLVYIKTQPTNYFGAIGDTATFTVEAENEDNVVSYQWQQDTGNGWEDIDTTEGRSNTYTAEVTEAALAYKYRCVITGETNSAISDEVQMIEGVAGAVIPVSFSGYGLWGANDSNWNWLSTGSTVEAGVQIYLSLDFETFKNHKLLLNGEELEMTESSSGVNWQHDYTVKGTESELNFELVESAWSEEQLSKYIPAAFESGLIVFAMDTDNMSNFCNSEEFVSLPSGSTFAIGVREADYGDGQSVTVNGTEYALTAFVGSDLYASMGNPSWLTNSYGNIYVTEAIAVSEDMTDIVVKYSGEITVHFTGDNVMLGGVYNGSNEWITEGTAVQIGEVLTVQYYYHTYVDNKLLINGEEYEGVYGTHYVTYTYTVQENDVGVTFDLVSCDRSAEEMSKVKKITIKDGMMFYSEYVEEENDWSIRTYAGGADNYIINEVYAAVIVTEEYYNAEEKFEINGVEYTLTPYTESSLYERLNGATLLNEEYGTIYVTDQIVFTDDVHEYVVTYGDETVTEIPVTITGLYGVGVHNEDWSYYKWINSGECVSPGYILNIGADTNEYLNRKLLINGTEYEMSENDGAGFEYEYVIQDTDTEIVIELAESPWSEEELNRYTSVTNNSSFTILSVNENNYYNLRYGTGINYLRDNSVFAVIVKESEYVDGYSIKINDTAYPLTKFTESDVYMNTGSAENLAAEFGSDYVTTFITVPEDSNGITITYETAITDPDATIPVTFTGDGLYGIGVTDNDNNWKWMTSDFNVAPGYNINSSITFDDCINHKLLINGEEYAMTEGEEGIYWHFDYTVSENDESIAIELAESQWSEEQLSKYIDVTNEDELIIYATNPDALTTYAFSNVFSCFPNNGKFMLFVSGDKYAEGAKIKVGNTEYDLVLFTESEIYSNMDSWMQKNISGQLPGYYTTDLISASDYPNGIEITYEVDKINVTLDSEYLGAWGASSTIPRAKFEAIGGDVLVKLTVETRDPEVGDRNYLAKPMNICVSWDAITFSLQSDTALSYGDGFFVIPKGTSTIEFVVPEEVWKSFLDYDGGTGSPAGLAFQVCDVIVKSAELSEAETAQSEITTVSHAMGPFIMDGMTYEEALEAVEKFVSIKTQPVNYVGAIGDTAKFTVEADNEDNVVSYQWQQDTGSGWTDINTTAGRSKTFSVAIAQFRLAYKYRCVITGEYNSVTSDEVQMIEGELPVITTQPTDVTCKTGETATFTIEATGEELTYQWELNDGNGWFTTTAIDCTSSTLTIETPEDYNGYKFRCIVTNADGSVTSDEVVLTYKATVPVTINGLAAMVHNDDWSYSKDISNGGNVEVGNYIYITVLFDYYINHKVLLNGEEVTLEENGTGTSWSYNYVVSETDTALVFELVESEWSEEQLSRYVDVTNGSELYMFIMDSNSQVISSATFGYSCLPNDCNFAVLVAADKYIEGAVVKVNGIEYKPVPVLESSIYEKSNNYQKIFENDHSDDYITEPIPVSNYPDGITITYEEATKLEITTQPVDFEGAIGDTANFTVEASGENLTYQWQQNTGAGWANINTTAGRKATFSIGITAARANYQYRCVVSDGTTELTTDAVKMIIKETLEITTQPVNFEGAIGDTAKFTVEASGENLTYQWQQNTGAGWANINTTAGRKATFSIGITAARANYQYRCVVSDGTTELTTDAVKMVIKETLEITTQPVDFTGEIGDTAKFTIEAEGTTSYQWQQNTGLGWANINTSMGRSKSFSVSISAFRLNYKYRCVVSDGTNTLTSDEVQMKLNAVLEFTKQPVDYVGAIGDTAKFTVEATGASVYQWQQNTGAGWMDIATTAGRSKTFSVGVAKFRLGYKYRCVISDGFAIVTSDEVKMVIESALSITSQPVNYVGAIGDTAKFTIEAEGATSYQWQQNTGAGWMDIATSAGRSKTFSVGVAKFRLGYKYRCVVSDGTNTLTSDEVQMILG